MDIFDFNPWWETGGVGKEFARDVKRDLFFNLRRSLGGRTIDAIIGLRRVGKTTIMYQLIEHLLNSGVEPRSILYFSFDLEREDLRRVIRTYEEKVLGRKVGAARTYLFFDEIHKLSDWANKIKVLYDLNPKVKIVISGSASLNLMRDSRESLAGRARFFLLRPLSFSEFLRLRGEHLPDREEYPIHERRIEIMLQRFLLRGFPQTIEMSDSECREYVRELVVERVIFRDIPETFRIADADLLRTLMEYISENPGAIINTSSLSKALGRNRKTVRKALIFMELSFLIKLLGNLRGSFLATSRKNRKAYPVHPSLCSAAAEETRVVESLVMSELDADYYWRSGRTEVDFVVRREELLPVEVKYRERVERKDLSGVVRFCRRFGVRRGVVVSRGSSGLVREGEVNIEVKKLPEFALYGIE
ncbi:MAG: ATP-binding protein [Euryarchaeota archaeon]|nr:ATP-binding protein [Euryarchaeota archaeon]